MADRARQYDIYLPLTFNDGRPIPTMLFDEVELLLLERFGGLTTNRKRFPLRGIWQGKTRLYVDKVIILTVFDFRHSGSGRFFTDLKKNLLENFEQEEVLITEITLRVY